MNMNLGLIVFVVVFQISQFCEAMCSEDAECFENICLEIGYCRDIRPKREVGEAIIVDMEYEIDNIVSVDTELKIVKMQVSLTQSFIT